MSQPHQLMGHGPGAAWAPTSPVETPVYSSVPAAQHYQTQMTNTGQVETPVYSSAPAAQHYQTQMTNTGQVQTPVYYTAPAAQQYQTQMTNTGQVETPVYNSAPAAQHYQTQMTNTGQVQTPTPSGPGTLGLRHGPGQASDTTIEAVAQRYGIRVMKNGFVERVCRLVFKWLNEFPHVAPRLITVLPDGTVETEKVCQPSATGACITFGGIAQEPQTPSVKDAVRTRQSQGVKWPRKEYGDLIEPLIFSRPNLTTALVQCWPVQYNDNFRSKFHTRQPASPTCPQGFCQQALFDFAIAMERLWGNRNCTQIESVSENIRNHIEFCTADDIHNQSWAVITEGVTLLKFLHECAQAREYFDITSVNEIEFVARITYPSRPGQIDSKTFRPSPHRSCVLYKKEGFETMACVKIEEQFNMEAQFR